MQPHHRELRYLEHAISKVKALLRVQERDAA
jgi:hypothetical protein